MVQAPGFSAVVRAYHDGSRFFVESATLMERLGFVVERQGLQLVATDVTGRMELDFARKAAIRHDGSRVSLSGQAHHADGRFLLTVQVLEVLFGSDIHFDERRLTLQLSSAATQFDAAALGPRLTLDSEVSGPLRFGRERPLLGGAIASWQVTGQWRRIEPIMMQGTLHLTASILGGALGASLGGTPVASYLFDRPRSRWLTRLEAGRLVLSDAAPVDAVRLSNMPLAALHVQRMAVLRGHATPHALVEALVGGRVTDRARADSRGRYALRVPTYYGSTEAVVRIQPLGGAAVRQERHYALATASLAPDHRLEYDAVLGSGGAVHVRYGLLPRLTVRASARHRRGPAAGITASPFPWAVIAADLAWPGHLTQTSVHLWHRPLRVEATRNRDRWHVAATLHQRRLGVQLMAQASRASGSHVAPVLTYHGPGGRFARLEVHMTRRQGFRHARWVAEGGMAVTLQRRMVEVRLVADGRREPLNAGIEALLTTRALTFGMSGHWHLPSGRMRATVTLQLQTEVFGLASRLSSGGTHTHSAYGSIGVGNGVRFSRAFEGETSALLRVFEDHDGDGHRDPAEPLLPAVEVQVFHAPLRRMASGVLRAMHLEPYAAYQVRIIEQSVGDPWLRPATGHTFSFVADPGRAKVIDIPLQRTPLIRGRVLSADRPHARLIAQALQGGGIIMERPVYSDGGFAFRLQPGTYVLQLADATDEEVLLRQPLTVPVGQRIVDVQLTAGDETRESR